MAVRRDELTGVVRPGRGLRQQRRTSFGGTGFGAQKDPVQEILDEILGEPGAAVVPEPPGLPPDVAQGFTPDLASEAVVEQRKIEEQLGLEAGTFSAQDLPPEERARRVARAQKIWEGVPGISGSVAASFVTGEQPIDDAIRQARARWEKMQPKSWWEHIPGSESVGGALHAAFIAGPEWLWRKTVVDATQEVAELTGVPAEQAQQMSPGQVAISNLHKAIDIGTDLVGTEAFDSSLVWRDGELIDPEEWPRELQLLSGAWDFATRMTLDPTLVLGKARRGLVGAGRAFDLVRPTAGAAQRVERLRRLADMDPERAFERTRKIVNAGRTDALFRFMIGDMSPPEMAKTVLGRNPMRRFTEDVARVSRDAPETAVPEILKRYGRLRKGAGMHLEQIDFLVNQAKKGRTHAERLRNVEEGVTSLLTGRFTPYTGRQVDETIDAWRSSVAMRNDAVRRAERLRDEAFGGEPRDTPTGGPRVDGHGRARMDGLDELPPDSQLAALDLGASRERAATGEFDPRAARFVREQPERAERAFQEGLRQMDDEVERLAGQLDTDMGVWIGDSVQRKEIIENGLDLRRPMGPSEPLAEFPMERVLDQPVQAFGNRPIRELPVLRGLNFLPHRSVNIEDPFWHEQMQRFGRRAGMDEEELTRWVGDVTDRVESPQAMAEVMTNFTRAGYRKLGMPEDAIDQLFERANQRTQSLFAKVGREEFTDPLYSSQALNITQLTSPNTMRAVRKARRSRGFAGQSGQEIVRGVEGILDRGNNIIKRLLISAPRTGLRVLLETQARALAMGFSSIHANPLTAMIAFPAAVFRPKTGQRVAARLSGKEVQDVAIRSGDVGMSQVLFEAGLLSEKGWRQAQALRFADMKGPIARNTFRKNQAQYINDVMLNDDLVRRVLFDGEEAARAWAKGGSASARSWRNSIRRLRKTEPDNLESVVDDHVDTVRRHMRQMGLDDEEVRGIVTGLRPGGTAQLTSKDLIGKEADEIIGTTFFTDDRNFLDKALDAIVRRNLADIEFIGRDFTSRRELWRETWTRVRRAKEGGQQVDEDVVRTLLRGGQQPRGASALERSIVEGAKRDVFEKLKWLFFDMSERSRMSESMRFMFPFGNAYQEVVQTWGHVLAERPWLPHLAGQMWKEADSVPGVTFTDPATGEKKFRLPLANELMRWAGLQAPNPVTGLLEDGQAYEMTGRLDGFNLVSAGLPIPGPIAQVPMTTVLKNKPGFHEIWQTLFPYGSQDFFDAMLPGYLREFKAGIQGYLGGEESNVDYARALTSRTMEHLFSQAKQGEPLDEVDDDRVAEETNKLFAIRVAAGGFFPASVREKSPLNEQIEFHRFLQEIDPDMADQVFEARHGPAFNALTQAKTKAWPGKPAQVPPTKKAREMFIGDENFREFVEVFGQVGWDLFHESWTGEFDSERIRDQILRGDRKRLSTDEIKEAVETSIGWDYYFQYKDRLEQTAASAGIANLSQKEAIKLRQARDDFTRRLRVAFPSWAEDFERSGGTSKTKAIARLAVLANVPQLQSLDAVQGLRKYFARRAEANEAMQQEGVRSLNAKASLPIKRQWKKAVRRIVAEHPHFARLWGRYLERDDPGDALTNRRNRDGTIKEGILERSGIMSREDQLRILETGLEPRGVT